MIFFPCMIALSLFFALATAFDYHSHKQCLDCARSLHSECSMCQNYSAGATREEVIDDIQGLANVVSLCVISNLACFVFHGTKFIRVLELNRRLSILSHLVVHANLQ
jgi:hypothetical protein